MTIETIETIAIPDAFCTALARVERVGPCCRLVFTVPDDSAPGAPMRVVTAKLMIPAEALPAIAAQLLAAAPAGAAQVLATAARDRATAH